MLLVVVGPIIFYLICETMQIHSLLNQLAMHIDVSEVIFEKHKTQSLSLQINASDERSSSTIESKILDVVQMNSVMADSKPKCLVS